jgi:hypothetical protein
VISSTTGIRKDVLNHPDERTRNAAQESWILPSIRYSSGIDGADHSATT